MKLKLYVVVSKTLSKSQQAVQAGHAVADFLIKNPKSQWQGHSLVYLTVDSTKELEDLFEDIQNWCGCDYGTFKELYWNDQLTSVAVFGNVGDKLRHLPLL